MIIKICGITTLEDARISFDAGADWIGLNLVAGPRQIDLAAALAIVTDLDEPARVVALLRAADHRVLRETLNSLGERGVGRVQLYGDADGAGIAELRGAGFEVIGVVAVADDESIDRYGAVLDRRGGDRPTHVLIDAAVSGKLGGTGTPANWDAIARARRDGRLASWPPILLAGGLTSTNVADAIAVVQPDGVDVGSGVEREPGRKDPAKIAAFIDAVRGVAR